MPFFKSSSEDLEPPSFKSNTESQQTIVEDFPEQNNSPYLLLQKLSRCETSFPELGSVGVDIPPKERLTDMLLSARTMASSFLSNNYSVTLDMAMGFGAISAEQFNTYSDQCSRAQHAADSEPFYPELSYHDPRTSLQEVPLRIVVHNLDTTPSIPISPLIDSVKLRKSRTDFRVGIMAGPFYFEWDEHGIVVPRKIFSEAHAVMRSASVNVGKVTWREILHKMSLVVSDFNESNLYNASTCNSFHFVETMLTKLNRLTFMRGNPDANFDYFKRAFVTLSTSSSSPAPLACVPVSQAMLLDAETFGFISSNVKVKTFASHKDFDLFIRKLVANKTAYVFELQVLKTVDLMLWMRYNELLKTSPESEELEAYAPLKHSSNSSISACPFISASRRDSVRSRQLD